MITVYTVAFNEEVHIQFMIDHYRSRFPECHIVVYDNMSEDKTVEIAKANNCEVISFDTNNHFDDDKHIQIKNNCWKQATTDWVLICDMDELLDISKEQLEIEEKLGSTIITSEGYNMVNVEDNLDLKSMDSGFKFHPYDKSYLFNKKYIQDINYTHGCHNCSPRGTILHSDKAYRAYHYRFLSVEFAIKRYKLYGGRLSAANIKNGWGTHYLQNEQQIKDQFVEVRGWAKKIL